MSSAPDLALRALPSVDEILKADAAVLAVTKFGRPAAVAAIRQSLGATRAALRDGKTKSNESGMIAGTALAHLMAASRSSLRPVFNLTGTVLHTNLGRATLAEPAIDAAIAAMRSAVALEFDVESGKRGERDDHVRELLRELSGAEDATVVNNNAAAVLLVLNTLGKGREAVVSRGELIEIGGAFRMPDIMAAPRAERGRDYQPHSSERLYRRDRCENRPCARSAYLELSYLRFRKSGRCGGTCRDDAGPCGTAGPRSRFRHARRFGPLGLGARTDGCEAVADGADIVTFSGDKLLGGPQAGFILGRGDLIAKINRNPMKRALRVRQDQARRACDNLAALPRPRPPGRATACASASDASIILDRSCRSAFNPDRRRQNRHCFFR